MKSWSRIIAVALVAMAALAVAGVASAAQQPDVWVQVTPAPRTPLAHATITVTDATGEVVGTGQTGNHGGEMMQVRRGVRPYLFTATGGTVDGQPFKGTVLLRAVNPRAKGIRNMDAVSTAAVRYVERNGGSYDAIEKRIFKGIGLSPVGGHHFIKVSTTSVDRRTMLRHHTKNGFDGTVAVLVAAAEGKRAYPDWSVARAEKPRARTTQGQSARTAANVPCSAQTVQASSAAVNVQVTAASVQMAAGLVSGFMTKDPSLFLSGAVGMAMSQTPGMTTASMLASIEAQLACISTQIAKLQAGVDKLTLAQSIATAATCADDVTTYWDQYDSVLYYAANPEDKSDLYGPDNGAMKTLINGISNDLMTCLTTVNSGLFNSQGGRIAAWPQIVANYESGDYRPNDAVALSQESHVELQEFLSYWGTVEYQIAALVNEYYNYQATFNDSPQLSLQKTALYPRPNSGATPCPTAPSLSNLSGANVTTSNLCQAQQNIANVWPADVYTDEVLYFKNTKQSSPYGYGGWGFSAVPVAWGQGNNTTPTTPVDQITPKYLADREIDKYDKRWNASAAVAYYNNLPVTDIGGLNQSIYFRRGTADPDNIPWCNGNCGNAYPNLSVYGPFFSQWLNSAKPDPVNGSYATVNLAPGSTSRPWQVLAKDGTVVFDDGGVKCGTNYDADGNAFYAHYTSHNTIYSPNPWTANSGGTIGGGTPYKGTNPCSVTVPIAFLKARGVGQGTTWPTAPVIVNQPNSTVSAKTTLSATNCPPGTCTWAISSDGAPDGLMLSSGGTFSWPGAAPGTTAQVEVVAGNATTYSAPVTLNVVA